MITGFTAEHGIPVDVVQDGYLFVVRDPEAWDGSLEAVALQRSLGAPVEVLDAEQTLALVPGLNPEGIVGATFGPQDGIADPGALTQGYASLASAAGARLERSSEVEQILVDDGKVTGVLTREGGMHAGAVVLAAGAWSGVLAATAGLDLPVRPVPRTVVVTGAFAGAPARRTLVIDAGSSFYFHREGEGVLMGMAGDDVATFDTRVDEGFVSDRLLPQALRVFPALAEAGVRSSWVGLYEMTPDRHPVVGPAPVQGLWIAAGFSGHGFQHGPVVGKLIADMIVDGRADTVDVSALSFDRFARGDLIREGHVV